MARSGFGGLFLVAGERSNGTRIHLFADFSGGFGTRDQVLVPNALTLDYQGAIELTPTAPRVCVFGERLRLRALRATATRSIMSTQESSPSSLPSRDVVFGPGPVFIRWTPTVADEYPELVGEVEQFDAGQRDAAQQAVSWLQDRSLLLPAESVARLLLGDGHLIGFYALASGSTELTRSQRRALGASDRRTQPATLLTQIARDIRAPSGTGGQLLLHAIAVTQRGARQIAATLLALDPHDSETAQMWKGSFGFRDSAGPGPGGHERRLWIPLSS
jgi:hypothetical protein